ncbi:MAG: tRNA (N(6)-L-threonylcarbamoyladenosine(37)-C(2))-methylthiotransferase [Candidatus Altiarchaeota archaeon]|nr:tRNA (N(6)-L-threonylcarbamoyladenosine(37)-C(2))-methylthiotransferase [Candidatus Altiarchaeota archaeon]
MRIVIETYGCAMNQADSEYIAGLLEEAGHVIVPADGDVIVVNTCTVKTPTEVKIRRMLKELEGAGKKAVVSGCLPAANPAIANDFPSFSFVGVNVQDVPAAVDAVMAGKRLVAISQSAGRSCLPKKRANSFIEIIPIAEGCLGQCAYCITRSARGKLRSYPMDEIVRQAREAADKGVKEIWLTAQDTGAYGLDVGTNLPKLITAVAAVPGDFMIRVGMTNPNHVLTFMDELIESYKNPKVYRFLHLPVQSGSDKVLKQMGRRYNADDFRRIADGFRKNLEGITISTDIIAGYPAESEDDLKATIKLIKETKPDIINISRYWARPGTPAAKIKQHPGSVIKQRSGRINDEFKKIALECNRRWLGWEGECTITERNADGSYTGRNYCYKPIILKSGKDLMGKTVSVKIKQASCYDLRGMLANG